MTNSSPSEKQLAAWVHEVVARIPEFLARMADYKTAGRYRYSMSGDIRTPHRWGLGNTVFAAKCYYMLDRLDLADTRAIRRYILSFKNDNGEIYDPLVHRRSRLFRGYLGLRYRDFNNFFGKQNHRAESRQAVAALKSIGFPLGHPYTKIPKKPEEIKRYIRRLNWNLPWGAASHLSHLAFFLRHNQDCGYMSPADTDMMLDCVFAELARYRQAEGAWAKPGARISNLQKVNGAMKVMTAFSAAGRVEFDNPSSLIDLCLGTINDQNACNNLNITCVLYHCYRMTDHRREEARSYCLDRINLFRRHWWPEYGGFSFFERHANVRYYGARISSGLPEPDIHGTHLFLWGIVLIGHIMGWRNSLGLKIPIT